MPDLLFVSFPGEGVTVNAAEIQAVTVVPEVEGRTLPVNLLGARARSRVDLRGGIYYHLALHHDDVFEHLLDAARLGRGEA